MPSFAPTGTFPPVGRVLLAGLAGAIPSQEITDELDRQLDRFEKFFGAPPDFIDGHQHVHMFPGIWPAVQRAFSRRLDPARCWMRDCRDFHLARRGQAFKAGVISLLSRAASASARTRHLRTNRGFSGFYDYGAGDLARFFTRMLKDAGDGHAMMVHPGHADDELRAVDSLTDPRERELAFLLSEDFPRQLAEAGFLLAPPGFLIDGTASPWQTAAS